MQSSTRPPILDLVTTTTATPTTCTVVVKYDGTKCGKPAVRTVKGRTLLYAECVEHDLGPVAIPTEVVVGATVEVFHGGKVKLGTITRVLRTGKIIAEVPLADGRTKAIARPADEFKVVV